MKSESNLPEFKKFLKALKENGLKSINWWGFNKEEMLNTNGGKEWGKCHKKEGTFYNIEGYDEDKYQGSYTNPCKFSVKFNKDKIEFISKSIEFEGNTEDIVMESIDEFNECTVNV